MFYFLRTCWWRGPVAFHCAWQNIPCCSLASVNDNLQVNKQNAPSPQRRSCEKAGQRYQHPILNRFSGANEHGKSMGWSFTVMNHGNPPPTSLLWGTTQKTSPHHTLPRCKGLREPAGSPKESVSYSIVMPSYYFVLKEVKKYLFNCSTLLSILAFRYQLGNLQQLGLCEIALPFIHGCTSEGPVRREALATNSKQWIWQVDVLPKPPSLQWWLVTGPIFH